MGAPDSGEAAPVATGSRLDTSAVQACEESTRARLDIQASILAARFPLTLLRAQILAPHVFGDAA